MGSEKGKGFPFMDIPANLPTADVAKLIPWEVADELRAVPLAMEDGVITVAVAGPRAQESLEAVIRATGHKVYPVLSPPDQLEAALRRLRAMCNSRSR